MRKTNLHVQSHGIFHILIHVDIDS